MSSPTDLYRIVYLSESAVGGDQLEHEVATILEASRRNNARVGITGALLFNADCFAQSLEGSYAEVQRVFERIQLDSRHRNSVVLQAAYVEQRDFPAWSMAYAGRVDHERSRFDAMLKGGASLNGAGTVLDLLRGVVGRAAPALS